MSSLQGKLLIAAPVLTDPNFHKTVVLLIQHNEQGALGLVLNRPTTTTICDAWEQLSEAPCLSQEVLHMGGPCEGVLMVVHTQGDVSQIEVGPQLHFTTEKEDVQWLLETGSAPTKFFVGYAGWSASQLDAELETGVWLVAPAHSEHVFGDSARLWTVLLRRVDPTLSALGLNPNIIPDDPSMN